MLRLFHFSLCKRLLVEWLISMHHTLESLTNYVALWLCLNQIRVNDSVFFCKHYGELAFFVVFSKTNVFLNLIFQHFGIQL